MNEYYQFAGMILGGISLLSGIVYLGIRSEFHGNKKVVTIDEAILDLKEKISYLGVVDIKQKGFGTISVVLSGFPFDEVLYRIPIFYKGFYVETIIEDENQTIKIK